MKNRVVARSPGVTRTLNISKTWRWRHLLWATSMLMTAAGLEAGGQASLAATPAPQTAGPAIPPKTVTTAEAFAQIPFIEQAELSPDGTHMAGLFGIHGERHICAMSLFDKAELHCIGIPDGNEPYALRWVNDQNIIISMQTLVDVASPFVTGPDRMYISRLIAMSRDTGKITKILPELDGQNASDVLWMASDGSPMIEVAGQKSILEGDDFWPAVYRVDVQTGHSRQIQNSHAEVLDWAADSHGMVRAGLGYHDENRTMRLFYRPERGGNLDVIERADTKKRQGLFYPLLFMPGTDHALVTHDDDNGFAALYEMDLNSQNDVRSVFSATDGNEVAAIQIDRTGSTLLAARDSGAGGGVHWFDAALGVLQAQFDKAVSGNAEGNRNATIISLDRDRKNMLVRIDRPDSPGSLYYYNVDRGTLQRIANYNELLGGRPLSPVRLVHYQARDGLPIEAVLTLPAGRADKCLPIVMMPHGGPWGQDNLSYDYWAQFIASQGYAVLQPNFRGSTGYGTVFLRKGEGQMGLAMQDDITDGLRWAVAQGIADPKRACIVGGSYGGYAAMWGIAKDPDLYRCAIAVAGVAALRREVDDFGNDIMGSKYKDDWARMTPDFAAVSPVGAVARIKAPLLLIHGEKDVTVDIGQSKTMYKHMLAAGKSVQFVDLPLADHHFGREADRKTLLGAMGEFLAKYNPADAVPITVALANAEAAH